MLHLLDRDAEHAVGGRLTMAGEVAVAIAEREGAE